MNQIYVDQGLVKMLRRLAANGDNDANKWFLFSNDHTPTAVTVLANLTKLNNPAPQTVTDAAFVLENTVDHVGSIQAPNLVFLNTSGGPVNAYGYGIMDNASTYLIAVARFDAAPLVIPDDDSIQVVPILADFSEFAS